MKFKKVVSLLSAFAIVTGLLTGAPAAFASSVGESLSAVTSAEELAANFVVTQGEYTATNGPAGNVTGLYGRKYVDIQGKQVMPAEFNIRYTTVSNNYHQGDFYFNYTDNNSYYCLGAGASFGGDRKLVSKTSEGTVTLATKDELGSVAHLRDVVVQTVVKPDGSVDIVISKPDGSASVTINDNNAVKPTGGYARYYGNTTGSANLTRMDWTPMQGIKTFSADDSVDPLKPVITAEFEMLPTFSASMIKIVNEETGVETAIELVSQSGNTIVFSPESELEYATDYSVKFSKNIKDPNGYSMAVDRNKEFTTAPSPIDYSNFKINNVSKDIEDLADYAGETVALSFDVTNTTGVDKGFMATVAIKSGDKLLASGTDVVTAAECDGSGGASMAITAMDIPSSLPDDAECVMYIWDSQEHMQALYPYKTPVADRENNITYLTTEVGGQVTITGNLGAEYGFNTVTLLMFNPKDSNDDTPFDATEEGAVQFIGETKANATGSFTFDVELNTDTYGYFSYYISSSGCISPKEDEFFYATQEQKNGVVQGINDIVRSGEEVDGDDITAIADVIGYNNEMFKNSDKDFIAQRVNEQLAVSYFSEDDAGVSFGEFVKKYVWIDAFNSSNSAYLYGADGEFLFGEYIDLTDNETYVKYINNLTETGQENVRAYMLGKNALDVADIEALFDEAVLLNMVNNRVDNTTGLASDEAVYLASLYPEIDILTYENISNRTTINTQLMNYPNAFESISDFAVYFSGICNDYIEATKYIDDSYYSYAFSLKDEDEAQSDFVFDEHTESTGFTFYTTYVDVAYSGTGKGVGFISKAEYSGDFSYTLDIFKSMNNAWMIINYQDDNNYYYYQVRNGEHQIVKVVNGASTVLATGNARFSTGYGDFTINVVYDSLGYIHGSVTSGNQTHEDVVVAHDTTFTSGKIGCRLNYSPGKFYDLEVQSYLSVINGNVADKSLSGERIGVNEELKMYFNQEINRGTVDGNVYLEDAEGNKVNASVEIAENGKEITITPNQSLEYAADYYIVINKGIYMNKNTTSVVKDRSYHLKTVEPPFNVQLESAFAGEALANGDNVNYTLTVSNETADPVDYIAIVALYDKDGNFVDAQAHKGTQGTSTPSTPSGTLSITQAVEAGATLEVYVFDDNTALKKIYPKAEAPQTVGKIAESNLFVTGTDAELKIKAYVNADEKVRVLILDAGKAFANVADSGAIVHMSELAANEGGVVEKTFDTSSWNDGAHTVIVAPVSRTLSNDDIVYTKYSSSAIEQAITDVNDGTKEASEVLAELGVDEKLSTIYAADIDTLVNNNKPFQTTDGGEEIRTFINQALILKAFNTNNKSLLYRDGEYLYDDYLSFDNVSVVYAGATATDFYETNMTDAGKDFVIDYLMNKSFVAPTDLYAEFVEAVVLYGIKNCNVGGYGHVNALLTNNADFVTGLNITNYELKYVSKMDYDIFNGSFADIPGLNTVISQAVTNNPGTNIYTPPQGGGDSSGKGIGSAASGFTSSEVVLDAYTKVCKFPDVPQEMDWCIDAINYLAENGIVSGDENGHYNPSNSIKREEFIKISVNAFDLKNTGTQVQGFADVAPGSWYEDFIVRAIQNGAINGYEDNTVGVGRPITRQEVAVILYRLIDTEAEFDLAAIDAFSDSAQVSDYAREALSYMVSNKIINGRGNGILAPHDVCTRAETAKIIYEIIRSTK